LLGADYWLTDNRPVPHWCISSFHRPDVLPVIHSRENETPTLRSPGCNTEDSRAHTHTHQWVTSRVFEVLLFGTRVENAGRQTAAPGKGVGST